MIFDLMKRSVCFCGRRERGYAYALHKNETPLWACSAICAALLPGVRTMLPQDLDEYEANALENAGAIAGAHLDRLGKTDLATLTKQEWLDFLELVMTEYGHAMRNEIDYDNVPF